MDISSNMGPFMTPFEYVTVLISIVLGMGITQLVSGLAAMIVRWEKIKIYWPHLTIIILVFVLHIQDWWATYELIHFNAWRLPTFLFFILYPVNLYILSRILFPTRWSARMLNLKAFYLANFRKIYLFMLFLPIHSIIDNHFLHDYSFAAQIPQLLVLATLLAASIFNKTNEWTHKLMAVVFIVIMITTFAVAWDKLLIGN